MVHLHGDTPMFHIANEFNVQCINWHDRAAAPDLALGRSQINGAACGGLSQWDHLHNGTPGDNSRSAREAIHVTNGRRFILSTGCVAMITSPWSNLRAVREAVETPGA